MTDSQEGSHDTAVDVTGGIFLKAKVAQELSNFADQVWFVDGTSPALIKQVAGILLCVADQPSAACDGKYDSGYQVCPVNCVTRVWHGVELFLLL